MTMKSTASKKVKTKSSNRQACIITLVVIIQSAECLENVSAFNNDIYFLTAVAITLGIYTRQHRYHVLKTE